MRILIVDDIQDNIDMLATILRSRDHHVAEARNGKEALDILKDSRFDMIISDILMPVMDGFHLCRVCKSSEKLQHIPFIFYTATYIDKKDEEFALSLGASRFLVKPQEPDVILGEIESVMNEQFSQTQVQQQTTEVPNEEVYRLYSERLINKLEKKMQDLEHEIILRKQAELELIKARDRAQQSDRLKSAFLANISHEIRTPLNGIIGFASLLKELKPDAQQVTKFVDIIIRSGQRLTSIIADIIEISKLETGQVTLINEEVNVISLLNSIYEEMDIAIPQSKNLQLVKDFSEINDTLVTLVDKTKLSQVLVNLISNAIKYTPEGNVTIGVRKKEPGLIEFYVRDTGIGIPGKYHHAIFERFRQVSDTPQIFQSGTGLGLAISKSYVELMGGTIKVNSELGSGSEFLFTIPYKVMSLNVTPDVSEFDMSSFDLTGKKVLIVEDDPDNYDFMEESLLALHAEPLWAKDGRSAIEMVKENPDIDLVLMDIRMPVMNGLEATKKILEIDNKICVVAQTAYAYSDDKEKALNAGCKDIITKPFTVQDFTAFVCENIR